jgi:hypothetical protein
MTALGFLYPGHSAEDDYPRIEQLLGSDIRLDVVHTDIGTDAHRVDALLEMGSAERLAAGVEELRMSGAESVVWACTSGSFVHGWEGAHEQVRNLAGEGVLVVRGRVNLVAHGWERNLDDLLWGPPAGTDRALRGRRKSTPDY